MEPSFTSTYVFSILTRKEKANLFSQPLFFKWLSDAYCTDSYAEEDLDKLAFFRLNQQTLGCNYFHEVCVQILDYTDIDLKLSLIRCCLIANIITEVTYSKLQEI